MMNKIKKITYSAMFLAFGIVLSLITMNIPSIGKMLLPMHFVTLISGFILGPYYGAIVGFLMPLVRTLIFGIPVFYPSSIVMAMELLTYAFIVGLFFHLIFKKKNSLINIYASLIIAMIFGRIVYGIVNFSIGLVEKNPFTFQVFLYDAFLNSIVGIIIQLILIPFIIKIIGGYKYGK